MIRSVYLDTCCVIYLLEDVPPFSEQIRKYMTNNTDAVLCVSPLVRLEALVKSIIDGNTALMTDYEFFLADQQWLTIGDAEFDRALTFRSHHQDIRTYLEPVCFAGFRVEYGELVWGDYELCFSVIDLYRNTIEHDQLMTKAA